MMENEPYALLEFAVEKLFETNPASEQKERKASFDENPESSVFTVHKVGYSRFLEKYSFYVFQHYNY